RYGVAVAASRRLLHSIHAPDRGGGARSLPIRVREVNTFRLPDLGEGLEEAEIIAWHVSEGDHVVADQPLVSVETDKAVVEVPSPQSGRIARLQGVKGDLIKVGAVLVEFGEGTSEDTGTVVGELEQEPHEVRESVPPAAAPSYAGIRAAPAVRALA